MNSDRALVISSSTVATGLFLAVSSAFACKLLAPTLITAMSASDAIERGAFHAF